VWQSLLIAWRQFDHSPSLPRNEANLAQGQAFSFGANLRQGAGIWSMMARAVLMPFFGSTLRNSTPSVVEGDEGAIKGGRRGS
jgi:hypothetical protein